VLSQEAGRPAQAVLMASHGAGAPLLQRCIVSGDSDCAALQMLARGASGPVSFSPQEPSAALPSDLMCLRQLAGLSSFVLAPIGLPPSPLGVVLLARRAPEPMASDWWQIRMHAVSMSLQQIVRSPRVQQMGQLMRAMDEAQDPVGLISVLLRVSIGCGFPWAISNRPCTKPAAAVFVAPTLHPILHHTNCPTHLFTTANPIQTGCSALHVQINRHADVPSPCADAARRCSL